MRQNQPIDQTGPGVSKMTKVVDVQTDAAPQSASDTNLFDSAGPIVRDALPAALAGLVSLQAYDDLAAARRALVRSVKAVTRP